MLEELSGKEVKVSSDPTCSRILESLIPSISEEHMQPLLAALAKGEEFCLLSSRCSPCNIPDLPSSHGVGLWDR